MRIEPERLKLFILDSELVSKGDFESAEKKATDTGKNIEDVLVEDGKISDDDLRRLHEYILGVPFVNLEQEKIDPRVLEVIPEPIARNHNIVPYKLEDRK